MLTIVKDLYVGWLSFQLLSFSFSDVVPILILREHQKCEQEQPVLFHEDIKRQKICFLKTPRELCSGDAHLSQWLYCEMWKTDIVSDLYIAVWKDLNSCKQHCNQCPICSYVPLVWMPFCHFFHPVPSGCLRTSNPEKRAHLPKEERSKLDF